MVLLFRIVLCMTLAGTLWALVLSCLSRWAGPVLLHRARLAALLFLLVPFWVVPLCISLPGEAPSGRPAPLTELQAAPEGDAAPDATLPAAAPAGSAWAAAAWIWGAGALTALAFSGIARLRFARRCGKRPCRSARVLGLLEETAAGLGLRHCPAVFVCENASPMLTGLLRPRLLLPEEAGEAEEERLRLVLRHELLHYKRRDLWVKLLAELARCIHWFNPAVWLLERQVSEGCELSCDALAVAELTGEERREYGRAILDAMERSAARRERGLCFGGDRKRNLKRRLALIMNAKKCSTRAVVLTVCLLLLLGAAGVGVCLAAAPELPRLPLQGADAVQAEAEPPYVFVQELTNSVSFDPEKEILSFHIPAALPEGTKLYLQIAGRVRMGEDDETGMSFHLYEQETADGLWKPGWTYAASLDPEGLLECTVQAAVLDGETDEELAAATVQFGPAGRTGGGGTAGQNAPPSSQASESGEERDHATVLPVALDRLEGGGERVYGPYTLKKGDRWTASLTWEGDTQLAMYSAQLPPGEKMTDSVSSCFTTAPGGRIFVETPFEIQQDGTYWFRVSNLSEDPSTGIRGQFAIEIQ